MTHLLRRTALILSALMVFAACGDDDATTTTSPAVSTTQPTATTAPPPTTTAAPATTAAATTPIAISDTGEVTIDWSSLEGVFFAAPVPSATDPFFHIHNNPATDGFFLSVEAYTTGYGTAWTGELGMFEIDCSPSGTGICVHFDPDGAGPTGDLGADFLAAGDIEILQADFEGFEAILTDVLFTDGTTIPGPLMITAGNAG
jgi:hypothetical protein